MNKLMQYCALIAVAMFLAACGSGSGSNTTNASLDSTYNSLKEGNAKQALTQVNDTLSQDPKVDEGDGWLLKSQIQAALGDDTAANDALKRYDSLFPKDSSDEFLLAEYEAYKGAAGDPQVILKNLIASMNDDYSGIDQDTWWGMVEESADYVNFRSKPEYQQLEALKPAQGALPAKCKEDKTSFVAKWWGTDIYIKHSDMIWFESVAVTTKFLSMLLPTPYNMIVAIALTARDQFVKSRDKGCGVVIHYTYLNWLAIPVMGPSAAEAFWVTSQK